MSASPVSHALLPKPTRQAFPDRLRGLALLGIIVVNAPFLGIGAFGMTAASATTLWDWSAAFGVVALAQGKFYLLFAFLFGYSAAFILKDGGSGPRQVFRRRLFGLAVIGLLHAAFFFVGDILMSYALLGTSLLLLHGRSNRVVWRVAILSFTLATAWLALVTVSVLELGDAPADDPFSATLRQLDGALALGSFLQTVAARLQALPVVTLTLGTLNWGYALCAFCLGLLASRRRLLADPVAHAALWRCCAVVGFFIGLPLQLLAAGWTIDALTDAGMGTTATGMAGLALGFASAPILAAGYLGTAGLLLTRWPRALSWTEGAGRMSLTLYIAESVVLSLLFSAYGAGLFGTLGAAGVAAVAVLTWAALELLARAWLALHEQGPLEDLLRAWSQSQRMLKSR